MTDGGNSVYNEDMTQSTETISHITHADIAEAQGGISQDESPITVTMPASYDPAKVTAADVVRDPAITLQ